MLFAECVMMSLVTHLYNIIQLSVLIGYQSGLACGFSVSCDYQLIGLCLYQLCSVDAITLAYCQLVVTQGSTTGYLLNCHYFPVPCGI